MNKEAIQQIRRELGFDLAAAARGNRETTVVSQPRSVATVPTKPPTTPNTSSAR